MRPRHDQGRRRWAPCGWRWGGAGLLALALLAGPRGAVAQEELFVTNFFTSSVTVYTRTANGDTASASRSSRRTPRDRS
jgi:hypothetical protein